MPRGELTAQVDDQPDDNYDNLDLAELQGLVDDILTQDDDTDLPATRAHFKQLIEASKSTATTPSGQRSACPRFVMCLG